MDLCTVHAIHYVEEQVNTCGQERFAKAPTRRYDRLSAEMQYSYFSLKRDEMSLKNVTEVSSLDSGFRLVLLIIATDFCL